MKSILTAAVLSGLAFTTVAHATPINYTFSVTATSGPLSGETDTGLRALDAKLDQMARDMARGFETVSGHLTGLTGRIAGLEIRLSAMEAWSADTTQRLARIERRLELTDAEPRWRRAGMTDDGFVIGFDADGGLKKKPLAEMTATEVIAGRRHPAN